MAPVSKAKVNRDTGEEVVDDASRHGVSTGDLVRELTDRGRLAALR